MKHLRLLLCCTTLLLAAIPQLAAQDQTTAPEELPIYEKLRDSHKLPKWAETACFLDGMHDEVFFVFGSDGGRWDQSRLGGVRLRYYDNGVAKPEIHLKLDRKAAGPSKYFLSDPYKPLQVAGWAQWQLMIDWDTNRFTWKSVSVNTGKNLFDESGRCIEIRPQ